MRNSSHLTEDYGRALVCREMGWTWEEYDDQPIHFLNIIIGLMRAEGENADRERSRMG